MGKRAILTARIRELERRLADAEETLRAIRAGEVDAFVTAGPGGDRVYTLKGADEPYRLIIQEMADGALTISESGLILFCNEQFAEIVGHPIQRVIGCAFHDFIDADSIETVGALLRSARGESAKGEIKLRRAEGNSVPVSVSVNRLNLEGLESFCLAVTNLTEQKRTEEIIEAEKLAPRFWTRLLRPSLSWMSRESSSEPVAQPTN